MSNQSHFISKAKTFRLHFKLSESDIDYLLVEKEIKYRGLELGSRTLTLELAEAYPLIYGIEYCDFKKEETGIPDFDDLPQVTKDYILNHPKDSGNKAGTKGTKNMSSYVIRAIKNYSVGHEFLNVDILNLLPPPLNQATSITWKNGLLKGLVKSTNRFKEYKDDREETKRGMIYTLVKPVTPELLEKALKNIEKG
ncbi:hypothetical protein SAMN05216436_11931 [bacterium A37T11]|nr:hypothetical protein SAMN05216436_11931 [bacterium A37T11]